MQTPSNPRPEHRLSEDEAHFLLARAAELDVRQLATVSLDELRISAVAAGISEAAFEQAATELQTGRIGRRSRPSIVSSFGRLGQVALAVALIIAAFRTPDYSGWWIAQLFGSACAVYGAYKLVTISTTWLGGLRGRLLPQHASDAPDDIEDLSRDDHSMAVRVLTLLGTPVRAA